MSAEVLSTHTATLFNAAVQRAAELLRAGEVATRLSHRSIYVRMIRQNIPVAIILEDDIRINLEQLTQLLDLILTSGTDWEVLLLHDHSDLHPNKHYFHKVEEIHRGFAIMSLKEEP